MRLHFMSRILSAAVVGVLGLTSQVQAAAVDFESIPANFYADGETFSENGYTLKVQGDFGVVDTASAFSIAQAPTGNPTQFYAGLNDSRLMLSRTDGQLFRLVGFDAGFIAPLPQNPGVRAGRIEVNAIDALGNPVFNSWEFAPSANDGSFAFLTYNGATDFSAFYGIKSATFDACIYVDPAVDNTCVNPSQNLGQFGLDNVNAGVVPEPSTYALMALGFTALAARARRATKR